MVLLLDDFHNIHSVRMPDNLKLSKATHMASVLLDIHLEIPAVKKPQCVHNVLKIAFRGRETVCRGGIVKRYMTTTVHRRS